MLVYVVYCKMRLNILIGGRAGQGINELSEIVSDILISQGYYVFDYRDYPSLIRGGHNFNILSISDKLISSSESKIDGILALDNLTLAKHKSQLKKQRFIVNSEKFSDLGINLNVALAGALIRILGIDKKFLMAEVNARLKNKKSLKAAEKGYQSQAKEYSLKKLNNKISLMSGSEGIAKGFVDSKADLYIAYPMTPATPVMHILAKNQVKNNLLVFQPENEIAVANSALGASFAGAKVMVGTSGGGYDLMTEAISMQGMAELPLVVYLASRAGPGTGIPTYTSQADLDIALRGGHGEFPRIVVAPGTAEQARVLANQAFYLSQKFNVLSIVLADKHVAESRYSFIEKKTKPLQIEINRKVPGKTIVKANSYEHDIFGNTIEDGKIATEAANKRVLKYNKIKKEVEKFEMIKIYGKKQSKNLMIGWGSTAGAIIDAIKDLDAKFLQVIYMKPMSSKIREEMKKAKKIILVEGNITGQLGRLIREKTGIKIDKRILKYDARPFESDKLKEEIKKWL